MKTKCWIVTKFVKEHSCVVDYKREGHRQATNRVIGECLKNRYISLSRTFKPKDIVDDVRERFGVTISYDKALRAREEHNPGSMTYIVVAREGRFKYCFLAFATSNEGYQYCRPIICVDGAHLKGKYKGMMFTAVLIVLDRHPSNSKAIRQVYPQAFHVICMQHLLHNIKNKFREISVDMLYYRCAKAYHLCEFEHLLHALTLVEPRLGPYLQDVGYERWSRAHSGGRQYNIMTTNISECRNVILVKEQELPITALAEEMRSLVQRWHYERRTAVEKCNTKLTPSAEALLAEWYQLSLRMRVSIHCTVTCDINPFILIKWKLSSYLYFLLNFFFFLKLDPACETVYTMFDGDKNGVVDLQARTCSCKQFQLEQLPCAHAMIAIRHMRGDVYNFCSDYYLSECWKAIYAGMVYPLPHQADWVVPIKIRENNLLPPDVRSVSGHRRKHQIPSVGKTVQRHKCSCCRQPGHHRKTHPNQASTSMEMPSVNPSHTF
ncbi:hypothetical protein UlMin_023219 [Ulmus minor]